MQSCVVPLSTSKFLCQPASISHCALMMAYLVVWLHGAAVVHKHLLMNTYHLIFFVSPVTLDFNELELTSFSCPMQASGRNVLLIH